MIFPTQETLNENDIEISLKNVTKDGYISQIMVNLTAGPILISFALRFGANLLIIGLLGAIPTLCNFFQIPTIFIIEKLRNRRVITVYSLILYRLCILAIGLIPFLFTFELSLIFLVLFLTLQSIFASIGHTAWNFWMHDLIPQKILGKFYSRRILLSTVMGLITTLFAGIFIDIWRFSFTHIQDLGYSILYFLGFAFGMISVYYISKISEPTMIMLEMKPKLPQLISEPYRDKNYKNLLKFLFLWYFTIGFTVPFFTVYMLEKLHLSLTLVICLIAISQIVNLIFLQLWGHLSDRFSNKSVLNVSCPLFLFCILAWVFTSLPGFYWFTMPLLILIHIFTGISLAGTTLALSNISLKLAPKGKANWYLAVTTLFTSIPLGIAPIIGGLCANYFELSEFYWTLNWNSPNNSGSIQILNLQGMDFFFIIALILGIFALHRLALVKEKGEVNNKIIRNEFLLEIRKSMTFLFRIRKSKEPIIAALSTYPWQSKRSSKKEKNMKRTS
ncbi:MAG: MFS transporter [Candidatus Hodarchaeota archaeon]